MHGNSYARFWPFTVKQARMASTLVMNIEASLQEDLQYFMSVELRKFRHIRLYAYCNFSDGWFTVLGYRFICL